MDQRAVIASLYRYNDQANDIVLEASAQLTDSQLDRHFEMGRGTLRTTLQHIWAGESVWLQRWQGRVETPWPDEKEPVTPAVLSNRLADMRRERDQFLAKLTPESMDKAQLYRDSKGRLFNTTLGDMVLQMFVHSTHHRAQAVNMLRNVGATPRDVDYMMQVRQPA